MTQITMQTFNIFQGPLITTYSGLVVPRSDGTIIVDARDVGNMQVAGFTVIGGNESPTFTSLTLSGLTQGSILFAGTGGVLSQDNSNFSYNTGVSKGAVLVNRSGLTGTPSGPIGSFSGFPQYLFSTSENLSAPATTIGGFESDISFVGGRANDGTLHAAVIGSAIQTIASTKGVAPGDGLTGVFSQGAALVPQGGTDFTTGARGRVWGNSTIASLYSGATFFAALVGHEVDVYMQASSSAAARFGVGAVDYGSSVQGNTEDAAFAAWASPTSVGFKTGISFTGYGGGVPLSTSATVLSATGSALAVTHGIDFNNFTFSGFSFRGPGGNYQVAGNAKQFDLTSTGLALGRTAPAGIFQAHTATDSNFTIAASVAVAGSVVIENLNDAANALEPIEARGPWTFTGNIISTAMPTADPHVVGQLYSLAGTVHVSAG